MTKFKVNGKEMDYVHIQKNMDGSIEVTYSEKFDIVTAHMSDIMQKIRNNGLTAQVFRATAKKYGYITIVLNRPEDLTGVLFSLDIPLDACDWLDKENGYVIVEVDKLPGHKPVSEMNHINDGVKA